MPGLKVVSFGDQVTDPLNCAPVIEVTGALPVAGTLRPETLPPLSGAVAVAGNETLSTPVEALKLIKSAPGTLKKSWVNES